MVRQCGYPRLYGTKATYENSMTYHAFLEDQHRKMHSPRVRMAVPETLHNTHVLTQSVLGAILGINVNMRDRVWQRHVLQNRKYDDTTGRLAAMIRVEFQDGSRKDPTQDYHGSGRPHVHWVVCAEKPESLVFHQVASASLDHEEPLRGYVEKGQCDKKHKTPWQVNPEESYRDEASGAAVLHHTQADHDRGVRAFFPDEMEAVPAHEDLQETNDDGALQAYLVKYPVKHSSSADPVWVEGDHGGDMLAQSVLFRYKPYEPEMVLQLFGEHFPQWMCTSISGGKRVFRVPVPDHAPLPREVELYTA
eukprot:854668-Karenia_brevis.AAC.1